MIMKGLFTVTKILGLSVELSEIISLGIAPAITDNSMQNGTKQRFGFVV